MDAYGDHIGEWQGVPVPLDGIKLRLCKGHPLADKVTEAEAILSSGQSAFACHAKDMDDVLVNEWFSHRRHARVFVVRSLLTGRYSAVTAPVPVDHSMKRLNFWLTTIGATDAWKINAEARALEKLGELVSGRQMRHYILTGSFIETSKRSQVTYLFRRLRPTVAMSPRNRDPGIDSMRCLAVLCLHPVGYYQDTWAGCMVPTDDVIAHLMLMRGDEPGFWRQATQHPPWAPEAGL